MKKSDIILLCSVIAVALILLGVFAAMLLGKGETVVVSLDGEEYARLPLNKDRELLIESERGTNLLVIKDRKAYIAEASCPDLVCVHSGNVSELKNVVCLPNRVVISLEKD